MTDQTEPKAAPVGDSYIAELRLTAFLSAPFRASGTSREINNAAYSIVSGPLREVDLREWGSIFLRAETVKTLDGEIVCGGGEIDETAALRARVAELEAENEKLRTPDMFIDTDAEEGYCRGRSEIGEAVWAARAFGDDNGPFVARVCAARWLPEAWIVATAEGEARFFATEAEARAALEGRAKG